MRRSYVVTGGGRGIGRAVVERLMAEGAVVVAIERDADALDWLDRHAVIGDASDEAVTERAADVAEREAPLAGWVNNAAVFRDASLHADSARTVLDLVAVNLGLAVVGCTTAIRRFLASGGGAIVNVSSHQARQAVPGATPYATAKAAIEGLTRALAVEYGAQGIRVNAVAPGTVDTGRFDAATERELAHVHPLNRVARPDEVAATIVHLLSDDASFVTGATIPVDGGRTVLAHEPTA